MNTYKKLLEYWNTGDLRFYDILANLSDQEIDEILEFCQDMPDDLRKHLVDFMYMREYFLNRKYEK